MQTNLSKIIVMAMIVIIAIAGVVWYVKSPKSEQKPPIKTTEDAIEAITAPPPITDVLSSPLKNKVPELNPVDKANPFNSAYKNPFE